MFNKYHSHLWNLYWADGVHINYNEGHIITAYVRGTETIATFQLVKLDFTIVGNNILFDQRVTVEQNDSWDEDLEKNMLVDDFAKSKRYGNQIRYFIYVYL